MSEKWTLGHDWGQSLEETLGTFQKISSLWVSGHFEHQLNVLVGCSSSPGGNIWKMQLPTYVFKQLSMTSELIMAFDLPQEQRSCQAEVPCTAQSCTLLRVLISHWIMPDFFPPFLWVLVHICLCSFWWAEKQQKLVIIVSTFVLPFLCCCCFTFHALLIFWTPVVKCLETEYSCCLPKVEILHPYLCWPAAGHHFLSVMKDILNLRKLYCLGMFVLVLIFFV